MERAWLHPLLLFSGVFVFAQDIPDEKEDHESSLTSVAQVGEQYSASFWFSELENDLLVEQVEESDNSLLIQVQSGNRNFTMTEQVGENVLHQLQEGIVNLLTANYIIQKQIGSGNNASFFQAGNSHSSLLYQEGLANNAITRQNGNANSSEQVQVGESLRAEVFQGSLDNTFLQHQSGVSNELNAFQNGYFNLGEMHQIDSFNMAFLTQSGAFNTSFLSQSGNSNKSEVVQNGSFNMAKVHQSGGAAAMD